MAIYASTERHGMITAGQIAEQAAQEVVTEYMLNQPDGESAAETLFWEMGDGIDYGAAIAQLVARAIEIDRAQRPTTMRDRVKRDLANGEYNPPKDPDMRERYAELWDDPNGVDQ